jgi:hypothetical protein
MPTSSPFPGVHNFRIYGAQFTACPHQPQDMLNDIRNARWLVQRQDEVRQQHDARSEGDMAIAASER